MRKSRIEDSTAKAQSRQSRIPGPKRSTIGKGDRRSISEDRGGFSLRKTSISAPRTFVRSSSATPMRTPKTPLGFSTDRKKTPLNDRKWFQDQIARIFDYLPNIEGLEKGFVNSRNIRSMSIRDFVRIFYHLAKFFMPKMSMSNDYIDNCYDILTKLHYPYNFNKSWLKTPNAPHALNHIVLLISWLLSAVPEFGHSPGNLVVNIDDLPTQAYAEFFQQSTLEAYQLWSNGDDQGAEKIHKEIVCEFLAESFGIASEDILKEEVDKLEQECEELQKEADALESQDGTMEKLRKEFECKKKQLSEIVIEVEQKERDVAMGARNVDELQKTLQMVEKEADCIQVKWDEQQKQNFPEKQKYLIAKAGEEKMKLQAMVELRDKLEAAGFDDQVEKARLLKKNLNLNNEIDLVLHQITKYVPSDFQLPPNFDFESLDAKAKATMMKKIASIEKGTFDAIQQKKMEIKSLKLSLDVEEQKKDRDEKAIQKITEKFNEIEAKRLKNAATKDRNNAIVNEKIDRLTRQKGIMDEKLKILEASFVEAEKKKEAILDAFENQTTDILRKKKENVEKMYREFYEIQEKLKQYGLIPHNPGSIGAIQEARPES